MKNATIVEIEFYRAQEIDRAEAYYQSRLDYNQARVNDGSLPGQFSHDRYEVFLRMNESEKQKFEDKCKKINDKYDRFVDLYNSQQP